MGYQQIILEMGKTDRGEEVFSVLGTSMKEAEFDAYVPGNYELHWFMEDGWTVDSVTSLPDSTLFVLSINAPILKPLARSVASIQPPKYVPLVEDVTALLRAHDSRLASIFSDLTDYAVLLERDAYSVVNDHGDHGRVRMTVELLHPGDE
jgi:hypothetical protein